MSETTSWFLVSMCLTSGGALLVLSIYYLIKPSWALLIGSAFFSFMIVFASIMLSIKEAPYGNLTWLTSFMFFVGSSEIIAAIVGFGRDDNKKKDKTS